MSARTAARAADRPARRATGPTRSSRLTLAATALASVATVVLLVAGCSSGPAASGSPAPSTVPSGASGPAASAPDVAPSGTPWPGNVPDAVIALGAFDEQMAAAAKAMDDAVTAKDLAALSAASKGLVNLVDANAQNVDTVRGYPGTKDVGDTYASAMAKIRAGAQAIVDGVAKGDAAAVDTGVADLSAGITEYGLARRALGPLLEQAISMKRMYMK